MLLPAAFKLPYVGTQFDIADHGYWTKPDIGLKRVESDIISNTVGIRKNFLIFSIKLSKDNIIAQ